MADPTPHAPTTESRRQVSTMVAFGIPQDKIAAIIGMIAGSLMPQVLKNRHEPHHPHATTASVQH